MKEKRLTKQSLIKGALILTAAGIIVRVLGAVYRIPLARILGDEGMGIYAVPNQFYLLFWTISSAGIPVAVARLVSEKMASGNYNDAYRTFRVARSSMLVIGLFFSLLLYFGAGWLVKSGIVPNPDCYNGLRAIAPVVFFAAITSSYRGFFQGMQNMNAVAASQVADQIMLVAGTLLFSYMFLPQGLAFAAAGANFGAVPGAVAATLIMVFYFRWRGNDLSQNDEMEDDMASDKPSEPASQLLKKIFATAVPISFASVSMALTGIIDNKLIIDRLQLVGYTQQQATAFYGQFNQMAMSFINISIAFAFSMGATLVPSISEAYAGKNFERIKKQVSQALHMVLVISLPAAAGLFFLAPQLTVLVFNNESAGVSLAAVSAAIIFWSIHYVTTGTLQGLGRADLPVKNLLVGIAFKILITYWLIPTFLEIRAAALGTVVMFIVSSGLNIGSISRLVGFEFSLKKSILRPALAVAIMSVAVTQVYGLLFGISQNNTTSTLAAVFSGMLVYTPAIVLVGGISSEELLKVPKIGSRAARLVQKFESVIKRRH